MLLLASEAPRSEHDPDPCACPEAAAANTAAANIAMNPVTGAFADPSHETACAAQLFRMALPCHAFLMALSLALIGWTSLSVPIDLWPLLSVLAFCITLGLVGRVLVHRMDDRVRGQRLGSWTWTVLLVLVVAIDVVGYVEREAQACGSVALQNERTIRCVVGALVNGSHGLGFGHKLGLIGLMLLDDLLAIAFCGEVALVGESMLVVGFVVAHLAEMHLRHSYVERVEKEQLLKEDQQEKRGLQERMEQLQTSNERLRYDMQRRGHPLDDDDERSAIRRGLQAEPSHILADGTDASEAEAPSDAPPPSLPPGPPSSSSSNATKFNKAGSTSSKSSKAGSTFTSSTYRASPSQAGHSTVPPPSWAELAYRRHYAELAVKSATEQGEASGAQSNTAGKSAAPPLTWPEFYKALRKTKPFGTGKRKAEAGKAEPVPLSWAEGDRQFYASAAGKAYLAAANRQPFNLMRNASTASSSSAASSPVARLATEPEAALAPPDARVASSHEQRHAESTGVAWLTPEERCIHSMQPELAAEIAEMGGEEVFNFKDNPLFKDMAERAELGEEEQEAFFKDNPLNMAEMAEMGEEEVFAALIALMGSTSEN